MTDYSDKAQRLIELLTDEDVRQIRHDNPFRAERNAKIRELFLRGVRQTVLAEVSGLSDTFISQICAGLSSIGSHRRQGGA